MDAPFYMLVFCTAVWCPLYEREAGYTLSKQECIDQMRVLRMGSPRQSVYCLRQGGFEIVEPSGNSRYTRHEAR